MATAPPFRSMVVKDRKDHREEPLEYYALTGLTTGQLHKLSLLVMQEIGSLVKAGAKKPPVAGLLDVSIRKSRGGGGRPVGRLWCDTLGVVRDLRLLRVFAVLRGGCGWCCRGWRMLRRRCGRCWLRRWRRTRSWRGWRRSCARRTRGCGRRTRRRLPSWSGCTLTWRCCSGWCSGGRRSGRGRSRRGGDAGGDGGQGRDARERHGRGSGARGRGRGGGITRTCPGFEVVWDFPGGGYCCPECGTPFTRLGSDQSRSSWTGWSWCGWPRTAGAGTGGPAAAGSRRR